MYHSHAMPRNIVQQLPKNLQIVRKKKTSKPTKQPNKKHWGVSYRMISGNYFKSISRQITQDSKNKGISLNKCEMIKFGAQSLPCQMRNFNSDYNVLKEQHCQAETKFLLLMLCSAKLDRKLEYIFL